MCADGIPATVLCVLSRSQRLSFFRACVVWPQLVSGKVFCSVIGSGGFQTQKNKSWVSGQVRTERVLAEAITIDGRREWDVQILFGVECVDKMALQPMLSQHPSFAVREV